MKKVKYVQFEDNIEYEDLSEALRNISSFEKAILVWFMLPFCVLIFSYLGFCNFIDFMNDFVHRHFFFELSFYYRVFRFAIFVRDSCFELNFRHASAEDYEGA